MKTTLLALFAFGIATLSPAQTLAPDASTQYTSDQLDQLTAPIAIYPDALIALILPASTAPSDIVLAARYLQANGDPAQIANQSWDDSVKALANYPEVVEWMNDNLDWTSALGRAFIEQPGSVMESIQQLRALALANGTLTATPQQNVVQDGYNLLIQPATPDAICIPEYDPDVVFADQPVVYTTPIIFFGPPCPVGPWLSYECDWDDFNVWLGTWHRGWVYTRDWRQPRTATSTGRFWRANNVHQRELLRTVNRPIAPPPRPRPMARTPAVAQRPSQGFRPAVAVPSSRPDPRGWRTDPSGHLAVTPAPAPSSGPRVLLSAPPTTAPSRPAPARPPEPTNNRVEPITPPANRSAPVEPAAPVPNRSAPARSPEPVNNRVEPTPSRPAPVPVNRPSPVPVSRPPTSPAPSGPLFGSYTRGTEAQDFSNRGQASRAAVSPPAARPAPAPRPAAPAPRPAPAPEPRAMPSSPAPNGANPNLRNPH